MLPFFHKKHLKNCYTVNFQKNNLKKSIQLYNKELLLHMLYILSLHIIYEQVLH